MANFVAALGVLGPVVFNPETVESVSWNNQENRIELNFISGSQIDLADSFAPEDVLKVAEILVKCRRSFFPGEIIDLRVPLAN